MARAPPRLPRAACRVTRAAADTVLLWGGHDGSSRTQFDDPKDGSHFAPHEARVARLVEVGAPAEGDGPAAGPLLRFGGCVGGQPPTADGAGDWFRRWAATRRPGACQEVLLHGLQSRSEINGEVGLLASSQANPNGRFQIAVVENGSKNVILAKPSNLCPGTWCFAPALAWCEELNLAIETHRPYDGDDGLVVNAMRLH